LLRGKSQTDTGATEWGVSSTNRRQGGDEKMVVKSAGLGWEEADHSISHWGVVAATGKG